MPMASLSNSRSWNYVPLEWLLLGSTHLPIKYDITQLAIRQIPQDEFPENGNSTLAVIGRRRRRYTLLVVVHPIVSFEEDFLLLLGHPSHINNNGWNGCESLESGRLRITSGGYKLPAKTEGYNFVAAAIPWMVMAPRRRPRKPFLCLPHISNGIGFDGSPNDGSSRSHRCCSSHPTYPISIYSSFCPKYLWPKANHRDNLREWSVGLRLPRNRQEKKVD